MFVRLVLSVALFTLVAVPLSAADPVWQSVLPAIDPASAVAGRWNKAGNELRVAAADGARIAVPAAPGSEYDFRVQFTRVTGQHSLALFFSQGGKLGAFEVDAWGEHLAGLQMIAGRDVRQNPTRRAGVTLENGRRYTLTVEVRKDRVRGLLDDREIFAHTTTGNDLSLPPLWAMPTGTQLGIGAWNAETIFHTVELRTVTATPQEVAVKPVAPAAPVTNRKPVLIVIANQDFFYREYADPRAELERAGFRVVVGAARKAACHPHGGSGQGPDGGVVQADIALADAKATDYEAILFSGGWGASAYQFAFEGRYNNEAYNGTRPVKVEANRLINEFAAADKYVCGLCNGVSVLAWSRVNGRSLLQGKRVCAPVREAPAGVYNGRPGQPSTRWHPEQNGAILSPPGAIGVPNSVHDDVLVDGKVITGEDDASAREMGRRLTQVLTVPASGNR